MVSLSDIPPVESMQEKLRHCDFRKFPLLKEKLIASVDSMLDQVATINQMGRYATFFLSLKISFQFNFQAFSCLDLV